MKKSSAMSTPAWLSTQNTPQYAQLAEDVRADVCVIGGGITGITTAYLLTKKGVDVVLLEKDALVSGESGRTTAHLSNAIDDRYTEVLRIHGKEKAILAAESHTAAIDTIERIVQQEGIDCDYKRIDGYVFLGHGQPVDILEQELRAAHTAGLTQVERLDHTPLPGYDVGPCLRFPNQGRFHPVHYLNGLARAAQQQGVRIYTHSRVTAIDEDAQPVRVHTVHTHTVTAQRLVVATNAPINDNATIYTKQSPYRSYVIAMTVPRGSVPDALYWDTMDPYHYVRLQEHAATHDLLIVGGEDHKTGQADDMQSRLNALERWTHTRFPSVHERVYGWSGQVQETIDGLALIGRKPGGEEWSCIATGDSGMGMTHGTIAGLMLAEHATGSAHPWDNVYNPSRFRLSSATEFVKENANVGMTMVHDWVKPSVAPSPQAIKPGSGAVIRKGISTIALYRDEEGAFHACSAVCPHKGCIVQWNGSEQSWDCPCHGSRYTTRGDILNGPTIAPLTPMPHWDQSSTHTDL